MGQWDRSGQDRAISVRSKCYVIWSACIAVGYQLECDVRHPAWLMDIGPAPRVALSGRDGRGRNESQRAIVAGKGAHRRSEGNEYACICFLKFVLFRNRKMSPVHDWDRITNQPFAYARDVGSRATSWLLLVLSPCRSWLRAIKHPAYQPSRQPLPPSFLTDSFCRYVRL